ncbi:2-keto-4-pentenoate hydratase [Endozoicomonas sp. NE40]|uniref:2-keto-4-pentenoate hydratase n=1 Tax=Endozoicomonas lisbonensis TaxID=3120522 RepID=A0ABV2SKQ4_9GAMM
MPCFGIVDSRIHNWQIKIQDTVADNASCGVFVLGDQEVDPNVCGRSTKWVTHITGTQLVS